MSFKINPFTSELDRVGGDSQEFEPTDGQTVFVITGFLVSAATKVFVNGALLPKNMRTISGQTITLVVPLTKFDNVSFIE
jgi:hypothetical protein